MRIRHIEKHKKASNGEVLAVFEDGQPSIYVGLMPSKIGQPSKYSYLLAMGILNGYMDISHIMTEKEILETIHQVADKATEEQMEANRKMMKNLFGV